MDDARRIVETFDRCGAARAFPVLDHPYVYLAASRLSLYRSAEDWALVVETSGFNPRAGGLILTVWTCASRLPDRNPPEDTVTPGALAKYLAMHPHDDARFFRPCDSEWIGNDERVNPAADHLLLRSVRVALPARADYAAHGIQLRAADEVRAYELCRWLAAVHRDAVLGSPVERRCSVRPDMALLLELYEWNHPNIMGRGERPADSEAFRELAAVLATGDVRLYRPTLPANNHWRNWPAGGLL